MLRFPLQYVPLKIMNDSENINSWKCAIFIFFKKSLMNQLLWDAFVFYFVMITF